MTDTLQNNQTDECPWVVETFPVGPLQCNCTIIIDPKTKEAMVVDPGGDVEYIMSRLRHHGVTKLKQILHTHAHFDHFMAAGELREHTEGSLALHPEDRMLWDNLKMQCERYNLPYVPVPPPDETLEHEQELSIGSLKGACVHTPGHTPGSMCFYFEPLTLLLGGDTLFKGSIGRTDLWGGDYNQIEQSIQQRLYTLDEATTVITGHGPATNIGDEMRHNGVVRALT